MHESLVCYIENNIIPEYQNFDKGHNVRHVTKVIERGMLYASQPEFRNCMIDTDMVYVIAAYHDIGLKINRSDHAEESAKILRNDMKIRVSFEDRKIDMMSEAIIRHRSIYRGDRGNVYGLILADADKEVDPIEWIYRLWGYRNHPGTICLTTGVEYNHMTDMEKFDDMMSYLEILFSEGSKLDGFEMNLKCQQGLLDRVMYLKGNDTMVMQILRNELGIKI